MDTNHQRPDLQQTALTRSRYDRVAPVYDLMNLCSEFIFHRWRQWLWQQAPRRGRILEIGIGTGKNIPFHPRDAEVIGVDLSPKMLARAEQRKRKLGANTELVVGDAQALDLPDDSIDAAVATFVFCSVPDAVLGLRELRRVLRPGGRVYLLEHMRATNERIGRLMDLINPLVVRTLGFNINRRTLENLERAGWEIEATRDVGLGGIFKIIVAHRPT
ncbi:MAG: methyltransferase domain-containing protein [Caldilinea sp. CFX5]|nr:methyltransferase domain-containing protein [Caldilinea sp. CFX5]